MKGFKPDINLTSKPKLAISATSKCVLPLTPKT